MNISVIGLGKLGLCTAACFASAGHTVYGYDCNDVLRGELKERRNPIDETGLTEQLTSAWAYLHIVESHAAAIHNSDCTLIIVPTPSMTDGRFTNEHVIKVLEDIAPVLAVKEHFHIVTIVSTVMPGSSETEFIPLLEKLSGKRCGLDFGLAYNPEFIALGSVIKNFLNPDMVLIGTSDERTGTTLTELYRTTCLTSPAFAVMSLINAEITKISLNCFVTMKISYANNLAAICEQVPEANVDVITAAIGADTRVGSKCLKGGLGFGGPCFPRDNIAFQAFATEYGVDALLGNAVVKINKNIPIRLLNKIKGHLKPPAKVALLGLSYKPDTHIIEESHSILLANALIDAGYQVALYDSIAVNAAMDLFGNSVSFSSCPYDCVSGAEVIVLLTDWPEFHCLDWLRIGTLCAPRALVLDSWRTAIKADMSAFTYIPIGVGIH